MTIARNSTDEMMKLPVYVSTYCSKLKIYVYLIAIRVRDKRRRAAAIATMRGQK